MRKNIAAGNWKMNTTLNEGIELALAVNNFVKEQGNEQTVVIIAPPFTHLTEISKVIDPSRVFLSAQNCASEEKGAFTGEVSPAMIKSTGAGYTIIGHSERRNYQEESDELLNKKVNNALAHDLIPIFCIGETLDERNAGNHFNIIRTQIEQGTFTLSKADFERIIVAYEPVWAIGTGVNATPEQAQEMHAYLRKLIAEKYGEDTAQNTSILYGGSCKPSNAGELFANPDVDGGLIGGASLKAEDFIQIINAF